MSYSVSHTSLLNLRHSKLLSKIFCMLMTWSFKQKMQAMMNNLSRSYKAVSLIINLDKIVVMFQPDPGSTYIKQSINVDSHKLKMVDKFPYIASTIDTASLTV